MVTGPVFLARHGQTERNAQGRYQGSLDSPLTALGRTQARASAETMRGRGVQWLLCSPLGRARHTARVVAEAVGLPVEVDAELAEISIGRWEGLTRQEVNERYPGERARRMRDPDRVSYRYAGGESLGDILTRARSVADRLDERTTLIVAHAGINRVLVAVLAGLEARLNDLYQPHDVIYRIGRATAPPVVTHFRDGAEHPGPYIAGWS